jgi:hypothetical protein
VWLKHARNTNYSDAPGPGGRTRLDLSELQQWRTAITPLFNTGERALAEKHEGLLGRIRQTGVPSDETDAAWPIFHAAGQLKSLHANGRSFVLSNDQFNREHKLPEFWEDNEQ